MNQTVDKGGKEYQERKNYMFGRFGLPEGMIHNKNDCGGYDHGDSFSRIISYGKEIYPPYDPEDVRVYRAAIEGIVSDAVEHPTTPKTKHWRKRLTGCFSKWRKTLRSASFMHMRSAF